MASAQPPFAGGRGQQPPQPMALVRRPSYAPAAQQQPVYLNLSQVTEKAVITRNSGKNLGTVGEAWVDPQRLEVVSFELEAKRGVSSTAVGTVPLQALKQIGDVVLVQDEAASEQVPLDSRYGFVKLLGMEVRSRRGTVLGKVRPAQPWFSRVLARGGPQPCGTTATRARLNPLTTLLAT